MLPGCAAVGVGTGAIVALVYWDIIGVKGCGVVTGGVGLGRASGRLSVGVDTPFI
jgi:hypothetical protein